MPTPAEGFIILLIVVVVFAIPRLPRLGDAFGAVLRNLVGRGEPGRSD